MAAEERAGREEGVEGRDVFSEGSCGRGWGLAAGALVEECGRWPDFEFAHYCGRVGFCSGMICRF